MGTRAKELSALAVSRIAARGATFVGGVTGLALNVTKAGTTSWVLRYHVGKKRRDMGLGGYPEVPLKAAKEKAQRARALIDQGIDPIEDRREKRSVLIAQQAAAITFATAVDRYIEAHAAGWKNRKHEQQWRNTLATHATSKLGKLLVRDVTAAHVLSVLDPIWRTTTETASRLRNRIELVLTGPQPGATALVQTLRLGRAT